MDKEINVKKLKTIDVETPSGVKKVQMVPVLLDTSENAPELTDTICTVCCPYGSICDKLRDPRCPSDDRKTLNDWCNDISMDGKKIEATDLAMYCPAEGSIEQLYEDDDDSMKQLLRLNPSVKLSTLIDTVCCDFCDMYNKEHSNCTYSNEMCICRGLFSKKKGPLILNKKPTEDVENTKTEDENEN